MAGGELRRGAQAVPVEITGGHHPDDGAPPAGALIVNENLAIPRAELVTKASRSSGAGGQHVNKTASRIEISWNVFRSAALSDQQRETLTARLASRLSTEGAIRVVASEMRSQRQNRDRAEARLAELVRRAFVVRKKRKPTRRPRSADEARLASKKLHSRKKRDRKRDAAD
jgi:ribosome-associated protein